MIKQITLNVASEHDNRQEDCKHRKGLFRIYLIVFFFYPFLSCMVQNCRHKLSLRINHSIIRVEGTSKSLVQLSAWIRVSCEIRSGYSVLCPVGRLENLELGRLHSLPEQPFALLVCLMVTKFFLISTQKPDIKSVRIQKEEEEGICLTFPTSILPICNLFPLPLLFSLYFNLSSTVFPSVTDAMYPSPLNVPEALLGL